MVVEKWVQTSREEKRKAFGEIGLHYDCVHYGTLNKKPFSNACTCWSDGKKYSRKQQILQCEKDMCFFYEPKRKDGVND